MRRLGYLGIDQYGQHYKIDKYPRKELLEKLGGTQAAKVYCDTRDGKTRHVGYVIRGLWIDIYQVHPFKEVA
jgi:hypothetical protein